METTTYRVNFCVSHPCMTADEIIKSFSFPVRFRRSVGERRITKSGMDLGGEYADTIIFFGVSDGVLNEEDVEIIEFIEEKFGSLPLGEIDHIIATGGGCFFSLGIYSENSVTFWLERDLLSKLSSHGIEVKFGFYGGPDYSYE